MTRNYTDHLMHCSSCHHRIEIGTEYEKTAKGTICMDCLANSADTLGVAQLTSLMGEDDNLDGFGHLDEADEDSFSRDEAPSFSDDSDFGGGSSDGGGGGDDC